MSGIRDDPFMSHLAQLRRNAEASMARIKELQQEIEALTAPQVSGAVRATIDADGRIAMLSIDPELSRTLDAAMLNREISNAVAEAARQRRFPTADQVGRKLAAGRGVGIAELLNSAYAGKHTDLRPEPIWNWQHTVAVTVLLGVVIAVTCDERWLAVTAPDTVAAEIIRSADQAITEQSDANGAQ